MLPLRSKKLVEAENAEKKDLKSKSWTTQVVISTNEDDGRQHIVAKVGPEKPPNKNRTLEMIERY